MICGVSPLQKLLHLHHEIVSEAQRSCESRVGERELQNLSTQEEKFLTRRMGQGERGNDGADKQGKTTKTKLADMRRRTMEAARDASGGRKDE